MLGTTVFDVLQRERLKMACRLLEDGDPACRGRYMMRLPDGTLSWSDEYEQRLREFLIDRDKQQNESDDGDAGVRDHPRNG